MFYRARRLINHAIFRTMCRGVLHTPPIRPTMPGPIILSMVSSRDFLLYLVAAKSLHARLRMGRFHVIDDGSLTTTEQWVIRSHLGAEIQHINAVPLGPTPRGGTWERLLRIADLVQDSYVIQMDSDCLTVGPIEEVAAAFSANASFTLVTHPNTHHCSVAEACAVARADPATDIHTVAEQILDRMGDPQRLRYIHGCSGFAGFGTNSFKRDDVYRFSQRMEAILGRRWSEWGSEQITSNFIIANAPGVGTIPYPKYRNFDGEPIGVETSFIHFMGTNRFSRGYYWRRARAVTRGLPAVLKPEAF